MCRSVAVDHTTIRITTGIDYPSLSHAGTKLREIFTMRDVSNALLPSLRNERDGYPA
jgi:hypothetical protein